MGTSDLLQPAANVIRRVSSSSLISRASSKSAEPLPLKIQALVVQFAIKRWLPVLFALYERSGEDSSQVALLHKFSNEVEVKLNGKLLEPNPSEEELDPLVEKSVGFLKYFSARPEQWEYAVSHSHLEENTWKLVLVASRINATTHEAYPLIARALVVMRAISHESVYHNLTRANLEVGQALSNMKLERTVYKQRVMAAVELAVAACDRIDGAKRLEAVKYGHWGPVLESPRSIGHGRADLDRLGGMTKRKFELYTAGGGEISREIFQQQM